MWSNGEMFKISTWLCRPPELVLSLFFCFFSPAYDLYFKRKDCFIISFNDLILDMLLYNLNSSITAEAAAKKKVWCSYKLINPCKRAQKRLVILQEITNETELSTVIGGVWLLVSHGQSARNQSWVPFLFLSSNYKACLSKGKMSWGKVRVVPLAVLQLRPFQATSAHLTSFCRIPRMSLNYLSSQISHSFILVHSAYFAEK